MARQQEIREDIFFKRWVIFSPSRGRRPSDFSSAPCNSSSPSSSCPFCLGREHECAPEIFRRPPDSLDWKLRVIENLYPALSRDHRVVSPPSAVGAGGRVLGGFGFHDVVIETPEHGVRLWDLSPHDVGRVLMAYRERIEQLESHASIKYVQVFKNHGASAGASMSHSHSQIMGLPFVPPSVTSRLDSMKEYFDKTGKCAMCELQPGGLLVDKSSHFFSMVPFAASYPFEIWIIPQQHCSHFHKLDNEKMVDLGGLLKIMLTKLYKQLKDPPFNLMIHSSPFQSAGSHLPYSHWFLQIVPHLSVVGGFEIGSNCYINPVFPEDAAQVLRAVDTL